MLEYLFTPNVWEDYLFWESNNKKTLKRINDMLKDLARNGHFSTLGKPEPLAGNLKGFYSRRINDKDRLVYKIEDNNLYILSCRYHYTDK